MDKLIEEALTNVEREQTGRSSRPWSKGPLQTKSKEEMQWEAQSQTALKALLEKHRETISALKPRREALRHRVQRGHGEADCRPRNPVL